MPLTVSLTPDEEALLQQRAQAQGVSAEALVEQVVKQHILRGARRPVKRPTSDSRGILAKYGEAPSAEEIEENRRDMFRNFARDDGEW